MESLKKYFLASNSCEGFVSYFDTSYDPNDGWKAYIIKGGPGTGKSTFMKRVAKACLDRGYRPHICPCSSDPDSLDLVVVPKIKTVIMDGTAPHTTDPKYAGAVENILNFGEFWDAEKLSSKQSEIIAVTNNNKVLHKTASIYLLTAGNLLKDNFLREQKAINETKIKDYAFKICRKNIKGRGKKSEEKVRFLSAVSPQGVVSYPETIFKYTDTPLIIKDFYGAVSNEILKEVRLFALNKGFRVLSFKNSFLPQYLEHIVIPALNFAVVTENNFIHFNCDARRVHFERFLDKDKLNLKRFKYNKKAANELLNSAVDTLKLAKRVHDDLEKFYIDAIDYSKLDDFTNEFIERILTSKNSLKT